MWNQSYWWLQQEAKDLNLGRNVWVFNHGNIKSEIDAVELHWSFCIICVSLLPVPGLRL